MYLLLSCYFMSVWMCVCLCIQISAKFMWKSVCDLQNQFLSLYHLCFWDIKFSLLGWEQEPSSAKPFNQFWTIVNHILGSLFGPLHPVKVKRMAEKILWEYWLAIRKTSRKRWNWRPISHILCLPMMTFSFCWHKKIKRFHP